MIRMKTASPLVPVEVRLNLPAWVDRYWEKIPPCRTDEEKMRLVLALARENVIQGTGGPFGAAIFRQGDLQPVAIGMNGVERLNNSVAHAEMLAIMVAEARLGSYTLRASAGARHELFTSCEPCAMCLGALLWSGLSRLVCGAGRQDALNLGFEEGPVFPESYRYLEDRGIEIVRGVLAEEARAVLRMYEGSPERIYNG
jgi:tRNA(Arg) A34 adenosine deaminase TadA